MTVAKPRRLKRPTRGDLLIVVARMADLFGALAEITSLAQAEAITARGMGLALEALSFDPPVSTEGTGVWHDDGGDDGWREAE